MLRINAAIILLTPVPSWLARGKLQLTLIFSMTPSNFKTEP